MHMTDDVTDSGLEIMHTDIILGMNPTEGNVKGQLVTGPNKTVVAEEGM